MIFNFEFFLFSIVIFQFNFLLLLLFSIYFKNDTMREVDQTIGDVFCDIIDLENRLIRDLEIKLLENETDISHLVNVIARLDCLLALASSAQDFGFVRPILRTDDSIIIEDGRHPIQELCVSQFIPNDTVCTRDSPHVIKLISGPNYSGKSVYIKQVGLIVYLAHIGSFVPAKFAEIGIVDKILTRISSLETVTAHRSSFFLDCAQVSKMIAHATDKSLLLIDEFGKGTNNIDGIALISAILNEFLRRPRPPKIFLTTHCYDVFVSNLLDTSTNATQNLMMGIHITPDSIQDQEVVYLYKLQEGNLVNSYGRNVAAIAGIPNELLERATEVTRSVKANEPVKIAHFQENEKARYQKIVNLFNHFDCETGNLSEFMNKLNLMK
jgi:DNA mismatch repair protein MSH5